MKKILGYVLLTSILISLYAGFVALFSTKMSLGAAFLVGLIPFAVTALIYGLTAIICYLLFD